jgi:sugar lactone lactonase YvrE
MLRFCFRSSLATGALGVALALTTGCDKDKSGTTTTTSSPSATSVTGNAVPKSGVGDESAHAPPKREPIVTYKNVGLESPESVLYDDANDVYLVSNVHGRPTEADNDGFIAKLAPEGRVETLKWIQGGSNKVTLNAPKGLAIIGDVLYVADIDTVRMFDRKTGSPAGDVKVPGATFLKDLAATTDGRILCTDMGLKMTAKGLEPSGTDAVYAIDRTRKITTVAKRKELGNPSGLYSAGDNTWVVGFGSGELYALDVKGEKTEAQKLPKGMLDGIVVLPGGELLVSSWEGRAVLRGKYGGDFTPAIENVKSPADVGYDTKRTRALVPLFESNEVQAFELK